MNGKIKWYDPIKGYGFIKPDEGEGDCFVHCSQLRHLDERYLQELQPVAFEVEITRKGKRAFNVRSL